MGLRRKFWLLPILLLLGCSSAYMQRQLWREPQPRRVSGWITLEAGRGLEDVDVTLYQVDDSGDLSQGQHVQPNAQGLFRFDDMSTGEYFLEITKPRYDPYYEQFYLEEGEGVYLEVELKRYCVPEDVWEVLVVGDFVDWDPQKALPMADDDGDGRWETDTPLSAGRYRYKYIINGLKEWFIDIDSGEYEPDSLGYYYSVVEIPQARLVTFALDTNDPWFRPVALKGSASPGDLGWAIWEPEEPRQGQEIAILYDSRGGPLEGAQQIFLHWGVNDWTVPQAIPPGSSELQDNRALETPMEPLSEGTWWVVIPTDQTVSTVDFVFTDGQRWDRNLSQEWHIPIR